VWVGRAVFGEMAEGGMHPCKVVLDEKSGVVWCLAPYAGKEKLHQGRYDLLPLTSDMEYVPTSWGAIPRGRIAVDGGYEANGDMLYHALATISGVHVPGKTGAHLRSAHFPFGNQEVVLEDGYNILCWTRQSLGEHS